MKFLVLGLGSMGKRRIRCLKTLGYNDIIGFDIREDRLKESFEKYDIIVFSSIETINFNTIDALIISTPPDLHNYYLNYAIKYKIPAFVEASVIIDHVKEIKGKINGLNLFIAPSTTFSFHPIIKDIKSIILSGRYGKVTNFSYHSGQYLPDWHPWENVNDFYVSKRETGGGREIVPFELTWMTEIFGFPIEIKGYFEKTIDFGANIEDSYAFSMKFKDFIGITIVDVASRFATRNLIINLEKAQILWNWNDGFFKVYEVENNRWIKYDQPEGKSEAGYNKNIVEEMYINEIDAFIKGIQNPSDYPNNLEKDIKVLELLTKIEESDGGF